MGIYWDSVAKYGSQNKAAQALGIPRTTFQARLLKESAPTKTPPPNKLIHSGNKTVRSISEGLQSKPTRILYFTDSHDQPGMSQERFVWLSKLVNDQKPDVLVDGGDSVDLNSLCSHERDETYKGRLKPLLQADLESAARKHKLMKDTLTHGCRKVVTLGNHEHRLWIYENNNPAMFGMVTGIYTEILESTGWEWHMYGEYINIAGVDFTHVPFNGMGKPVGGDNATKQIAEKSLNDVCYGHTHYLTTHTAHKFGSNISVTAFNGGCFMPDGYIPSYCKNTRKAFWYGAHLLTVLNGKIQSIKSWHIAELEEMYG